MRVDQAAYRGEIELGVSKPGTELAQPVQLPGEIGAFTEMAGGDIQDCVEAFITDERSRCPEANCCLQGLSTSTSQRVSEWTDDRDTSFDFPTTTIEIICTKAEGDCKERVELLTERIALFGQSAVQAKDEADRQTSNINQRVIDYGERLALEASEKAKEAREKAETEVVERRNKIFSEAREDIEAPDM